MKSILLPVIAVAAFLCGISALFANNINVTDYGVVASWDTSDAPGNNAGFQSAISAAGSTGKNAIYIPDGHYYISDTIDLVSPVAQVTGGKVILQWVPGANGTGKAMLRVRQKKTVVSGIYFLGDTQSGNSPDTGIDLYPTSELMLQGTSFTDVWVYNANVGVWSHNPPNGSQHEMMTFERCNISGYDCAIKLDKIHCDLWTVRASYLGHTSESGASIRVTSNGGGMGMRLEHSWLIGPNLGIDMSGSFDDITFDGSGCEGPEHSIDFTASGYLLKLFIRGQGLGAPAHVPVNHTLSIQSENAQFAARSDGTQYAFIIDSGAAVVWDSNRDRLYLDGYNVVSYPGGTDKLPDFATYIKTGSGLLEFAPIYVWQRVIPEPLRIGGSNTNWFLPADKVMLEVQSLNSTSIAAQFKDHQGNKKLEINNTGLGFYGATPAAKPTLAGSCGGNTAVQSIAAALASLGLVTNNTTP